MSNAARADKLQNEINTKIGRREHNIHDVDDVMDAVKRMMKAANADFIRRDEDVEFFGMDRGERVQSTADITFACFGEGKDAAWVAFCFYKDGWANAMRPYTDETATMGWLDAYIIGEFAG